MNTKICPKCGYKMAHCLDPFSDAEYDICIICQKRKHLENYLKKPNIEPEFIKKWKDNIARYEKELRVK